METKEIVDVILDSMAEKMAAAGAKSSLELKNTTIELKNALVDELGKDSEHLKAMQDQLDQMATKMKTDTLKRDAPKNVQQRVVKALKSEAFANQVKSGKGVNFSFKAIDNADMIAGDNEVVLPFREIGVDKAPVRPLLISQIIMWGTTSGNTVDWIERTTKTNAAAQRAEDATMAQGALGYTERSVKVKITSEFMKATKESLKDVDFLASEINSELLSDVQLALDNQLLSGDGTGNNHKGVLEYAQAFAAGSFATAVQEPNEFDVLRVAINQIVVAGKGKFMPNYILLHPTDATKMDLIKDANNNYIIPPFKSSNDMLIKGVRVIANTGVTEGDYLVGDFNRAKGFMRDPLEIRVWDQNEDDPIYSRATITANVRAAFRIKNQDAYAFVTGDFATDIAAITKP